MLSSQLHYHLSMFSQGKIALSTLEEWITPRLRFFFEDPDSAEGDVVATIEAAIVEYRDGLISETELRSEIEELLNQHETVHYSTAPEEAAFSTVSSSSHSTYRQSRQFSSGDKSSSGNTIVLHMKG